MKVHSRRSTDDTFRFDDIVRDTVAYETYTTSREPIFRLSSAPFCPLRTVFEWDAFVDGRNMWSFKADFYTGIGTATHSNLQKWIPLLAPAQILGHWRCKHCCKHSHADNCRYCTDKCPYYAEAKVGPLKCPECDRYMTYEEFQYLLPDVHVSGHSDGILLYNLPSVLQRPVTDKDIPLVNKLLRKKNSEYSFPAYILEYKTTSRFRATGLSSPLVHHKAQATMYASAARKLLKEEYNLRNLDIRGILIKYISRDSPDVRSQDFLLDIPDDMYYDYNIRMVKRATRAIEDCDVELIYPKVLPCNDQAKYSEFYAECPFKQNCEDKKHLHSLLTDCMGKIQKPFIRGLKNFRKRFGHPY